MSADTTLESLDLKKPLPTEVVEDVPPPAYDVVDVETAIPQSTVSPESRPVSRVKTFFLTILYTAAFAIMTLIFCLHGLLVIGLPHDEKPAVLTRATCASILGSVILGPIYFIGQRSVTLVKARNEVVNIHIANGRLREALGHSLLLCVIIIGVVTSAAAFGYGLIFWPLVYSESFSTKKMVVDAVCIPAACLLGGLRWTWEVATMMMWILIRIPKISTGLEGDKHSKLIGIAYVLFYLVFGLFF
jgi:hypothetical protein